MVLCTMLNFYGLQKKKKKKRQLVERFNILLQGCVNVSGLYRRKMSKLIRDGDTEIEKIKNITILVKKTN
jgi:hypothetical protein